jgi:hypothetical protein
MITHSKNSGYRLLLVNFLLLYLLFFSRFLVTGNSFHAIQPIPEFLFVRASASIVSITRTFGTFGYQLLLLCASSIAFAIFLLCAGRNFGADQLRRIWSAQGYFTILHDKKLEVTAKINPAPDKT